MGFEYVGNVHKSRSMRQCVNNTYCRASTEGYKLGAELSCTV